MVREFIMKEGQTQDDVRLVDTQDKTLYHSLHLNISICSVPLLNISTLCSTTMSEDMYVNYYENSIMLFKVILG